jgi:hypothetical protein
MVLLNVHYRVSWCYQTWLFCATWVLPVVGAVEMKHCGFFKYGGTCGDRDFFLIWAAAIGKPTLSDMALGQNRLFSTVGFMSYFCLIGILFFGKEDVHKAFFRNTIYCE